MGINTPSPIGYIEEKQFGIIRRSYYVCAYQPYRATITGILGSNDTNRETIIREFTRFTFTKLHQQGVLHKDYSGGNILVEDLGEDSYRFSIIDLNRMNFKKKVSTKQGLKNQKSVCLGLLFPAKAAYSLVIVTISFTV
ncbi:MAG TPA: lipopolysaccharide kinase InaA family protein, partial [Tenuifilaceae bacterium]|nr:lipopolysaccharide kinase InaA family protein [Tenuifilaceae bacterium]